MSQVNFVQLVSFNFSNFCARYKVLHIWEVTDWEQCVKVFLHEIWFPLCILRVFTYFPRELLTPFYSRTVPFENITNISISQIYLWNLGIKLEVELGFEIFQMVWHWFLGCQSLRKCRIFYFGQFLMHQKTFQGF